MRPLTDSRSDRVVVDRGSIAYSQVTQPRPDPLRQRGTPSVTLAVQSTRVAPNSTSTDPSACMLQSREIVTGRSWSGARPSGRSIPCSVGEPPDEPREGHEDRRPPFGGRRSFGTKGGLRAPGPRVPAGRRPAVLARPVD